jgi:hypothetical protein
LLNFPLLISTYPGTFPPSIFVNIPEYIWFIGCLETVLPVPNLMWSWIRWTRQYIKKKGYREGLYQIAHTPDICQIEIEVSHLYL